MIDFNSWPVLAKGEKKVIYHAGLEAQDADNLCRAGWTLQDVRLLPEDNEEERTLAVKAWLQGVRQGSIEPNPKASKFIELEMRTLGMLSAQVAQSPESKLEAETIDGLLNFGKK